LSRTPAGRQDRREQQALNRRGALSLLGLGSAAAVGTVAFTGTAAAAGPADATPADGGSAPTVVNVANYGATGDGATDDTDAIQAAVAASRPADAIFFPPGTYLVRATLRPKGQQTFFSASNTATLKAHPAAKQVVMFTCSGGPITFDHLNLDLSKDEVDNPGNANNITAIVVQPGPDGTARAEIVGCDIANAWGRGINYSAADAPGSRLLVQDTTVRNCGTYGLSISHGVSAVVRSSSFQECGHGLWAGNSRAFTVSDCTFTANQGHGFVTVYSQDWHVDRCLSVGNGRWGICAGGVYQNPAPPVNSDFTITNNRCIDNGDGGITLDPTLRDAPEAILDQRSQVSGNLCQGGGIHGINITHCKNVVVADNVCHGNANTGIQVSSSSHVMVAGNACFNNAYGVGLSSNDVVIDPGFHLIGVNMLHHNGLDLHHEHYRSEDMLPGVRVYGMGGPVRPEGTVIANPGTLYEWHDGDQGLLYVKASGYRTTGWVPLKEKPGEPPR
jgi:hypothetical protein